MEFGNEEKVGRALEETSAKVTPLVPEERLNAARHFSAGKIKEHAAHPVGTLERASQRHFNRPYGTGGPVATFKGPQGDPFQKPTFARSLEGHRNAAVPSQIAIAPSGARAVLYLYPVAYATG